MPRTRDLIICQVGSLNGILCVYAIVDSFKPYCAAHHPCDGWFPWSAETELHCNTVQSNNIINYTMHLLEIVYHMDQMITIKKTIIIIDSNVRLVPHTTASSILPMSMQGHQLCDVRSA